MFANFARCNQVFVKLRKARLRGRAHTKPRAHKRACAERCALLTLPRARRRITDGAAGGGAAVPGCGAPAAFLDCAAGPALPHARGLPQLRGTRAHQLRSRVGPGVCARARIPEQRAAKLWTRACVSGPSAASASAEGAQRVFSGAIEAGLLVHDTGTQSGTGHLPRPSMQGSPGPSVGGEHRRSPSSAPAHEESSTESCKPAAVGAASRLLGIRQSSCGAADQ